MPFRAGTHKIMRRGQALSFLAAAMALLTAACAETQLAATAVKSIPSPVAPKPSGTYKIGNPYQIGGVWYYPAENYSYNETGIASWYGADFHAKPTANGEVYDMNALTAAHQTLPMPSVVRVTNLENGRQIMLRVNDRGPFARGRILDVSRRGAQLLGFEVQGTAKVRVELMADESRSLKLAMLGNQTPAEERVAIAAAPRVSVQSEALPPPPGFGASSPPPSQLLPRAGPVTPLPQFNATAESAAVFRIEPVRPTGIFIQAGAFANFENARRVEVRLTPFGKTEISQVNADGRPLFRVRVGPVASVAEADNLLEKIGAVGYPDARLIVDPR